MLPTLAQVLNTLAHEIRTPLAVSQGYLKLCLDGRLATPDDRQRALQQTREALGVIAELCAQMSTVSALSDARSPVLLERLDAATLMVELGGVSELAGATCLAGPATPGRVASNASQDLVRAIAVLIRSACDHDPGAASVLSLDEHEGAWLLRGGAATAVTSLPDTPDGAGAVPVTIARGGQGLTLIWALFVLDQHGIQTWRHQDHKAAVAFRVPVVPA